MQPLIGVSVGNKQDPAIGLFELVDMFQEGLDVILSRKSRQMTKKANVGRIFFVKQRNVVPLKILQCQRCRRDFGSHLELLTTKTHSKYTTGRGACR